MRFSPIKLLHGLLYAAPVLLLTLVACGGGSSTPTTPSPVVAPSAAPTVSAPVAGCYAIDNNWTAVTGATGYNVYGSAASGVQVTATNRLTATPDTATSYTDAGLPLGTTRYYKVTAVNSAGEGPGSNEVTATTQTGCTNVGGSIQGNSLALTTAVSTLAGTAGKLGSVDGTGASAQFSSPASVTTDGTNLYVADKGNNVIRKIVIATGVVSTVAGTGIAGNVDSAMGPAQFFGPQGITTDGTNLYVADTGNNSIRKIDNAGVVTTLASSAVGAFSSPAALTFDGTNLYVADAGSSWIKMVVISTGVTSQFASVASPQGITYTGSNLYVTSSNSIYRFPTGLGPAAALLTSSVTVLQGITTDGTNLYVANTGSNTILKTPIVGPSLSIVAGGTNGTSGSTDGTGSAALFNTPGGITTDGTNLYITDTGNQTIRKIQ
jgi:DNA-binding beta-propeller fold protein YncE